MRADPPQSSGAVIWITGLSGAGKSTLAARVAALLRAESPGVVLLDGDVFRELVGDGLGHDAAGRLANAYRLARFAAHLSLQGLTVVCATMSLFAEVWAWNRAHMPRYVEVYLRVPRDVLERRDPKGLYARARRGEIRGVVGVDLPIHEPDRPDLVLDNAEERADLTELARVVVRHVATGRARPQESPP